MLNAAIIGFGGISKAHRKGYDILEKEGKVKLVAACDIRKEAFENSIATNLDDGVLEKGEYNCYTDLEEMLSKEKIDFLDICLPSFLHADMAVDMLNRGYNVLCEKPMALCSEECERMLEAQRTSGNHFMIAQCLRFFNQYVYLKECIDDGRYGKVLGAFFNRNSAQPIWGWENWFEDYERCGGAITDIHIHDIDIVRYLFGEPEAVVCRASDCKTKYDIVQTSLYYGSLPVTALGCWTAGRIKFAAYYKVDFEKASIIYDGGAVTVYPEEGEAFAPQLEGHDGYTEEISYFCDVVEGKTENTKNPAYSAARSVRLVEAMKLSADKGGEKVAFEN